MNEVIDRELLSEALREIVARIERCGASIELTHAVSLAVDLMYATSPIDDELSRDAMDRVRNALRVVAERNERSLSENVHAVPVR